MSKTLQIALVLALGPVAWAQQAIHPVAVTDQAIEQAITKGADFLWSKQKADGSWEPYSDQFQVGPTALAVYALMESGVSPQDERMVKALDWLGKNVNSQIDSAKELSPRDTFPPQAVAGPKTYELGLAANAFMEANKGTANKYMPNLQKIAKWLYSNSNDGAYSYTVLKHPSQMKAPLPWDNSNSQYGLLGVWAAATADMEGIPRQYWQQVLKHWLDSQSPDGGWTYRQDMRDSTASMTAAGLASLFVCYDNLSAEESPGGRGGAEFAPAIDRGLDWITKHFYNYDSVYWTTYYFFGVERVGMASGLKYFGDIDWYLAGCRRVLPLQQPDGGWGADQGQTVHDTAFAMLFLIRGRLPVLFNKLQYSGDWNERPRDMAGATRWLTNQFEKTVTWQIINTKAPVAQWHDAPILYISGAKEPKFTPQEVQSLRQYVLEGGTILAVSESGGGAFPAGIRQLSHEMFPQYPLAAARPDNKIYSKDVQFDLHGRPILEIAGNGIRPFVILCPEDLAKAWQFRQWKTNQGAFQAMANVYMYVTDSGASLHPRGTTLWPGWTGEPMQRTVKIARLQVVGASDSEPLAYKRFAMLMADFTRTRVEVLGPMPVWDLAASGAKLATVSGTEAISLTNEEQAALKKFVQGGGTLLFDSAGGSKAFADSAKAAIDEMYGADSLQRVSTKADVFRLKGYEIDKFKYRRKTRNRIGRDKDPDLHAVVLNDRLAVIFSAQDITTEGLLGVNCFGVDGYDPGTGEDGTAYQIMRNIVLYAGDPQPYVGPASQASGNPTTASAIHAEDAQSPKDATTAP